MRTSHYLPVALLVSGFLITPSYFQHGYHFVSLNKSWTEAYKYCRESFIDLATMRNRNAQTPLKMSVPSQYEGAAWIGVLSNTSHWWWADHAARKVVFYNWGSVKQEGYAICVMMLENGMWLNDDCSQRKSSVCFKRSASGNMTYHFIGHKRKWGDARRHCRRHFSDLVFIQSSTQNQAVQKNLSGPAWIGLRRHGWEWSNQRHLAFNFWAQGQPNTQHRCVKANFPSGNWYTERCDEKLPFICTNRIKKVALKLKLQCDGDLTDPAIHSALLQQLHTTLGKEINNFTLQWTSLPKRVKEEEAGN